jgi:hypothetical protein
VALESGGLDAFEDCTEGEISLAWTQMQFI